MPLYEYECDACGSRFERIQKFSDPPVEECPSCGGSVRKLLSSPAIQFKGTGWYITDYAAKGKAERAEGKAEGKGDGKADTSPAQPTASSPSAPGSSESSSSTGSSSEKKKA